MKNSIIYLGLALVTFTNVISASNARQSIIRNEVSSSKNKEYAAEVIDSKKIGTEVSAYNYSTGKVFSPIEEEAIFNPDMVLHTDSQKSIEEIIAENNTIIESSISNEISFLYLEKSPEEIVAEDNQIIQSTISNEISFLYLEKSIEEIIAQDNQIIESTISNEIQSLDLKIMNETSDLIEQNHFVKSFK